MLFSFYSNRFDSIRCAQSYEWITRVTQAIEGVHQVRVFCVMLVQPNSLPRVSSL